MPPPEELRALRNALLDLLDRGKPESTRELSVQQMNQGGQRHQGRQPEPQAGVREKHRLTSSPVRESRARLQWLEDTGAASRSAYAADAADSSARRAGRSAP